MHVYIEGVYGRSCDDLTCVQIYMGCDVMCVQVCMGRKVMICVQVYTGGDMM